MEQIDVAIIGAGVVGLAIASEVAKDGREVYVLEKHGTFGRETSDRNSEVIHAGLYYEKGSLNGRLGVEGKHMIYEISEKHGVPTKKLGKILVATTDSEVPTLADLVRRGQEQGVNDLVTLDGKDVKKLEPNVEAVAGVYSPSTGILSAHSLMKYFISKAKDGSGGVEPILYGSEVVGIDKTANGYKVTVQESNGNQETISAKVVINSAGLYSDKIAELAGIDADAAGYRLHFCKGEYFALSHKHKGKVSRLVYPVPGGAGLGVHITLDLAGEMKLGPDASYMPENVVDYTVNEAKQKGFFESANKYLPFVEFKDLQPDQAGIRPKLFGPGQPKRDFVIQEESARGLPGLINLIGIESPGLTASPAIGKYVGKMVDEILEG